MLSFCDDIRTTSTDQKDHVSQSNYRSVPKKLHEKLSKSNMIIQKCLDQNKTFTQWQKKKSWKSFHSNHYDWWAFPIDETSSYGDIYKLNQTIIDDMKQNQEFLNALRSNAIMVCEAWGYDLQKGQSIKTQDKYQKWQNWPVRLYKMTKSLQIFGFKNEVEMAKRYAKILISKEQPMSFKGHSYISFFTKVSNESQIKN